MAESATTGVGSATGMSAHLMRTGVKWAPESDFISHTLEANPETRGWTGRRNAVWSVSGAGMFAGEGRE